MSCIQACNDDILTFDCSNKAKSAPDLKVYASFDKHDQSCFNFDTSARCKAKTFL